MRETMRVFAKIDLSAVRHNLRILKALPQNQGALVCAVLKADGYGHGAVPIARMLEQEDLVDAYAVATADEGVALRRQARVKKPVMILGYAFPESDEALFRYEIQPSVFRTDTVESLEETAARLREEGGAVPKLKVHIPVDTGMGRIGVTPDDAGLSFVRRVLKSSVLQAEGLFTHFARADEEEDDGFTARQTALFAAFQRRVEEELGYRFPLVHADNSAAMLTGRGAPLHMVRAGIAMYGLYPTPYVGERYDEENGTPLKSALSFYSHISFVKEVPQGTPVSYGGRFVTKRPSRIATVPIGYADGYPRALSENGGEVLIRGHRAKVAGRICMDQFMVDVTDFPDIRAGDKVTLIGTDGTETISAETLGMLSGRFHYELLCCINKRVPRIYV